MALASGEQQILRKLNECKKCNKFAAKVALGGVAKSEHVTPFLKELGWLKINQKYKFEIATTIQNLIYKNLPNWLFPLPSVSDMHVHSVNTRQIKQLHVPRCNTCLGNRSFQVAAPTLWNSLPNDVKHATSLTSFKKRLKIHLLGKQFQL